MAKVPLKEVLKECKRRGVRFAYSGLEGDKKIAEQARSCAAKAEIDIKKVLSTSNITTLKKLLSKVSLLGGERREVEGLFRKAEESVKGAIIDFNELKLELDRHIRNDFD